MPSALRLLGLLMIMATVASAPTSARSDSAASGEDWLLLQLSHNVQKDTKVDLLRQRLRTIFRNSDIDGNGVSARDYELAQQIKQAQRRAEMLRRWGRWDLNNDGKVTRAEIELFFTPQTRLPLSGHGVPLEPTPEQSAAMLAKLTTEALAWDRDNDGTITFAEVREAASDSAARYRSGSSPDLVPLSLDNDHDGTISFAEFDAATQQVLAAIDQDGNGTISAEEATAFRAREKAIREEYQKAKRAQAEQEKLLEMAKACGLPSPGAHSRIVLVGAYEGAGLSTVSLGDEDKTVTVSDISVESGSEPLYVVLTSYTANIWRFSGSVERIERVVAGAVTGGAGDLPRVGVISVAKERVTITGRNGCLPYFYKPNSVEARRTLEAITLAVGRPPDSITGTYSADRISIPLGSQDDKHPLAGPRVFPHGGPAAPLWEQAQQYNPAGIIEIDPSTVVAALPVQRFAILPQQAGLAQLVEQGALEIFRSNQALAISNGGVRKIMLPTQLVIRKKMRFPSGLYGGHSTTFILPPGVAEPDGNPGHSRVIRGTEAAALLEQQSRPGTASQN